MKKIIMVFILAFIFSPVVFANTSIEFVWDKNTEPDVAGYRLYKSAVPDAYILGEGDEILEVGSSTSSSIITVEDGEWWFVLTAFDISGNESGKSNEVTSGIIDTPPLAPSLTIKILININ